MNLVEIKNVSFGYLGNQEILKNINIKVEQGDFLCIIGENGSGKSTLAKCILGLNKTKKGTIIKNSKIGYLPQKTEVQTNFPATISEIVLTGTIPNGVRKIWYSKEDKEIANNVMKELGLYDMRKTSFSELSGGQQQRVLIARALCMGAEILLLDEPTNGLDPSIANQIYKILHKLNKEKNITIIMISHDIDRAMKYCSKVVQLENGKVTFSGTPSDMNKEGGNK